MSVNINAPEALWDAEGKPDPVSEITTATVLMIQKRCSSTLNVTKIDTALPLESLIKHLTTTPTTEHHHARVVFVTPELSRDVGR